jgi:hypothetical protein
LIQKPSQPTPCRHYEDKGLEQYKAHLKTAGDYPSQIEVIEILESQRQ